MPEKNITIIIPAKDEEASIARCIESVFIALEGIKSFEIILVDSYSLDRTVEIAKQYPIRILRLKKNWPKSPAAGRYLGAINSNSKYISYLDADMAVHKDWIKNGLKALEENKNLAGVTGVLCNVFPGEKIDNGKLLDEKIGHVDFLPGAAMYRGDVLKKVNHFNPFIQGYEEMELACRILPTGLKLLRINKIIAYHLRKERNYNEIKEKVGYGIGSGQFLRLHFNIKNIVSFFRTHPQHFFMYCFFIFFLTLVILSVVRSNFFLFVFPILLSMLILLAVILKHRNLKKTGLAIFSKIGRPINFLRGFFKRKVCTEEYPKDVEVIQ